MAISLLVTPIVIKSLGFTNYGVFALVGSLSTYFGILDFGIGGSLARFMTFYRERGEYDRIKAFATFGCVFYLLLALVVLPLLILSAPAVGNFLKLPPDTIEHFSALVIFIFGLFIGWALTGIIAARLSSIHRLDIIGYANILSIIIYAVCIYFYVPYAHTIESVFACMTMQLAVVVLCLYLADRRFNGKLLVSPFKVHWPDMRELFSFGLWSQFSSITAIVNLEADKAIISRKIGVEQVAPYHVANRLALLSRALPLQLLGSLLPTVTSRISQGVTPAEIRLLYQSTSRNLMIPTLIVVGFVAGSADALLKLWLGTHIPGAASLCVALVISYAVNNVTGAGTLILRAEGNPQLETFYGTLSAVLNIGLTILLTGRYGLDGVVFSTIVGNVVGSTVFVVLFHRRKNFDWWDTMGRWLTKLLFMTVSSALLVRCFFFYCTENVGNRGVLFPAICVAWLGYCTTFYFLGRVSRFWIAEDRALWDRVKRVFRKK